MEKLIRTLILAFSRELINQGHRNTGSLINSLTGSFTKIKNGFDVSISGSKYAIYLDKGVTANRIPYSGRGGGGKSKYIQALIAYFKQKGAVDPKAAAFATANKHKKEGMPTRASYRFSNTGKRKGFINDAIQKNDEQISREVFALSITEFDKEVKKVMRGMETHGGGSGVGGGGVWIF